MDLQKVDRVNKEKAICSKSASTHDAVETAIENSRDDRKRTWESYSSKVVPTKRIPDNCYSALSNYYQT